MCKLKLFLGKLFVPLTWVLLHIRAYCSNNNLLHKLRISSQSIVVLDGGRICHIERLCHCSARVRCSELHSWRLGSRLHTHDAWRRSWRHRLRRVCAWLHLDRRRLCLCELKSIWMSSRWNCYTEFLWPTSDCRLLHSKSIRHYGHFQWTWPRLHAWHYRWSTEWGSVWWTWYPVRLDLRGDALPMRRSRMWRPQLVRLPIQSCAGPD